MLYLDCMLYIDANCNHCRANPTFRAWTTPAPVQQEVRWANTLETSVYLHSINLKFSRDCIQRHADILYVRTHILRHLDGYTRVHRNRNIKKREKHKLDKGKW